MKTLHMPFVTCCAVALPAAAHAQGTFVIEHDVQPHVVNDRIETDAVPHGGGVVVPDVQHFGYEFGEDPKDPFFLADPGFDAEPGSGLPGGSLLSFNVARHLAYWNGAGRVSFTTPPNNESLRFNFGADDVTVTGTSGPQDGFAIGTVAGDGSLHRHLNTLLQGPNASTDPMDGVYFTNIRLTSSSTSIAQSDSLYMIFNNGLTEVQFNAALAYLTDPLPGDANFDGAVNLADFNVLAANFGAGDRFWYQGDFNGDRTVNLADFNLLAGRFGQTNGAAAFAPVPEPVAAVIVPMLVPLLVARRRRKYP